MRACRQSARTSKSGHWRRLRFHLTVTSTERMERTLAMAQHAQLYIVASRHPRVGKTLLARLLIEFLRLRARPVVGYDLEAREPALATCYPNLDWPVDITDTRGQMALFDRMITAH